MTATVAIPKNYHWRNWEGRNVKNLVVAEFAKNSGFHFEILNFRKSWRLPLRSCLLQPAIKPVEGIALHGRIELMPTFIKLSEIAV